MTVTENPVIPSTHKACVYSKPGSCAVEIRDVPTPKPGPGEVLVKLTHSGVCHSDYSIMMSNWSTLPYPTPEGQVGGHEGLGHIVKLGEGSAGVKLGDRVGIKWVSSACLACYACLEGMDGVCYNQRVSGYFTPGTFQEYVIGPANYVTPVPESIPAEVAAPMLCAGVTTYAALKRSGARPGQWVVVLGAGGGLGTVATSLAARGLGLRVIGVDGGEKREAVLAAGAEHFVDRLAHGEGDEAIGAAVRSLASSSSSSGDGDADAGGDEGLRSARGAAAVIVCTASNGAYAQGMGMLGVGGALVCVGMPEGAPVPVAAACPTPMIAKMQRVVASAVGNRREAAEVLAMAARGVVRFPVRTARMAELQGVFEDMAAGRITGRVVLDMT